MTELAVLARTILEGINARDLDTVASFLDPGYEAEWPEGLLDFEGSILREAAMLTALPDTRFEIERISPIAEDRVLVEAWANGTLQDRLDLPYGLTAPATGRSIRVPILFLMLALTSFTAVQRFVKVWKQASVERPETVRTQRRQARRRAARVGARSRAARESSRTREARAAPAPTSADRRPRRRAGPGAAR